jgi:hypothetical protein
MSFRNELHAAVAEIAGNPKVSAAVSTATAGLGMASAAELIGGVLSSVAIIVGIIATGALARVHVESHKNQVLHNKILRKQLIELGGDPDGDD